MRQTIQQILAPRGRMRVDPPDVAADANLSELRPTSHASVNVMLALEELVHRYCR
ncbi:MULTISPECIES: hypothetical protein [unclassified Mycolicibacterium]|uniref:hypothetical protein n=1 Tax=unclassified Mycolicibacterium TaxID=2636767 RepID=UPI001EE4048C|nr:MULTISPECIES: hypothetical protein [unclassified Mycolicibacterium]